MTRSAHRKRHPSEPASRGGRAQRFSSRRVREAGSTAGETAHPERNTADDLAPDTLLDEEGGQQPAEQHGPQSADTLLRVADDRGLGLGDGRDEAEQARVDPISPAEHRRLQRRIARSGGDVTQLEPNESRAGSPGRRRNRRR
jgi:hypothetical protein